MRKNAYIVIKGRPCKVGQAGGLVYGVRCAGSRAHCNSVLGLVCTALFVGSQVVDVSTSKTGKHGHAKCAFVAGEPPQLAVLDCCAGLALGALPGQCSRSLPPPAPLRNTSSLDP